jgi:ribosome-binding factor A
MGTHRIKRIQEEIQHAASSILLFEVTDPVLQGLTVTRVVVTKDVGQARIYYESSVPKAQREALQQALDRARGFVRRQLASRLNLKSVPEVQFFYDDTSEEVSRIEGLFSKI